jgi:hypothetical protein
VANTLAPCPTCARHIRVRDSLCPFCGAVLGESFRTVPAPRALATRLTRAALYALGAGTIGLASACSSSSEPADAGVDGPVATPAYGAPGMPFDAASPLDAGTDAPVVAPAYGAPGMPLDAGTDGPFGAPAYGAPGIPLDGGTD